MPSRSILFSKARQFDHSSLTECSGAGVCKEGVCECMEGFHGSACERTLCPTVTDFGCNSMGRCLSLFEFSKFEGYDENGDGVGALYSLWDGPVTHGCVCDWRRLGADCSLMSCPKGMIL